MSKPQTQNGRIVLPAPTWHESGANLPAQRPQVAPGQARRHNPLSLPTKAPQRNVRPDFERITTATNRWLVDTLDNLMATVQPIEVYGRVVLCKFVPYDQVDPVLPVPLVRLPGVRGWLHKRAYRDMVTLLIMLEGRNPWLQPTAFVKHGKRRARTIIKMSKPFLTPDEWRYYSEQIWESVTNPFRKDWREKESKQ